MNLESVLMLAMGWSSTPCSRSSRLKSHNSNFVSSEKSASTAPALVPVTTRGESAPGLQANAAVLGISRSLTILVNRRGDFESWELARGCITLFAGIVAHKN